MRFPESLEFFFEIIGKLINQLLTKNDQNSDIMLITVRNLVSFIYQGNFISFISSHNYLLIPFLRILKSVIFLDDQVNLPSFVNFLYTSILFPPNFNSIATTSLSRSIAYDFLISLSKHDTASLAELISLLTNSDSWSIFYFLLICIFK